MKAAIAFFLIALLTGCAGRMPAPGTAAFVNGEYQVRYNQPLKRLWEAALDAMKEMNISVYSTRRGSENEIDGTRKDGADVRVVYELHGPETTIVKIRVGRAGDETFSRRLNRAIQQKLGGQVGRVGGSERGGRTASR